MSDEGFTSNATEVAGALLAVGIKAGYKARPLVAHYGALLQAQVRAGAGGRPGPNVQTGDYRRSISLDLGGGGGVFSASVGTNRPQARRLEFGFRGRDSRGRTYNQAPLPHWGPAVAKVEPMFEAAVAALADFDAASAPAIPTVSLRDSKGRFSRG